MEYKRAVGLAIERGKTTKLIRKIKKTDNKSKMNSRGPTQT